MEFLDYEALRFIWWALVGVLLIGFAVMDGFDLGVATLHPFIGRTDDERRVLLNSIGPTWDGNQVWLILGAGAVLAAWPTVYAVAFSGLYAALLIVLFSLFMRPVAIDYRSKLQSPAWRSFWDWGLFVSGLVPALIFGVTFGNLLQGVPFHFDDTMRSFYTGGLLDLLNPFALLAGLVSVSMLVMQGASFLTVKTDHNVYARSYKVAKASALLTALLFVLAGIWVAFGLDGFQLTTALSHSGPSNPLLKDVSMQSGAWMENFRQAPVLWIVPAIGVFGSLAVFILQRDGIRFIASSLGVAGIIATAGVAMFPFVMPSSTHPAQSLTMWDATSSEQTLFLMLVAAVIFVPLIVAYTSWVFHVLRGRVTVSHIRNTEHTSY